MYMVVDPNLNSILLAKSMVGYYETCSKQLKLILNLKFLCVTIDI